MNPTRPGLTVQSLSTMLFAGLGALLSVAARADVYHGISNTQKLVTVNEPFNQAAELRLGTQVAAGGGQVLSVGGNAVYVFRQDTAGAWTQTAKLTASDSGVLTGPIAFDGTYALVRGYMPDQTSVVYAYIYDAGRWRSFGRLKGTAGFGESVALDGCTALISSSAPDGAYLSPVYVHYFDRCRTGSWTWINSFTPPPDANSGSRFGASIALTGNEALVGAPRDERVYYYVRSGDTWQLRQTLTANVTWDQFINEPLEQMKFGRTIARQGNVALIRMAKTYKQWQDVQSREGIVLQFTLSNGVWTQTGQMEPIGNPEYPLGWDLFGDSIVLTPTWAFISAPGIVGIRSYSFYPREEPGAVFAYPRTSTGFGSPERISGSPYQTGPEGDLIGLAGQPSSHFGQGIAVMDSTLVVGWPMKTPDPLRPQLKMGATAVYQIPPPQ